MSSSLTRNLRSVLDEGVRAFRDARAGLRGGGTTTWLAFGILTITMAAGTVTFSVVDATTLRPLPYAAPDRLVRLLLPSLEVKAFPAISVPQYFAWAEQASSFEGVAASRFIAPLQREAGGVVEKVSALAVTSNLFDVLGVRPFIGRTFGPEHGHAGAPPSVILGYEFWVRRFGGDPTIVGRQVAFADGPREVIGVLPRGVWYPITAGDPTSVYVPYVATPAERVNSVARSTLAVARLRTGVRFEQARADMERFGCMLRTLDEEVVGPQRGPLLLMLAAVGVVMLVACLNVGILLLARTSVRRREFAIRESLGASRRYIAGVVLLEALILSVTAAVAAVVASIWGVDAVRSNLPFDFTRVSTIAVNARVLAASALMAVVCAGVFGMVPAWRATRTDLVSDIRTAGAGVAGRGGRQRALVGFLVADVSFVYVLLVATTLVIASFVLITTADLGFDRHQVATLDYHWTISDTPGVQAEIGTREADLLQRAKAVPGVTHAAIRTTSGGVLSGGRTRYSLTIPGYGETARDDMLATSVVSPEYPAALGMKLLRGRAFRPEDRAGSPSVMLINDVAARRFFAGRDPIGQVVELRGPRTIVGVLRGLRAQGPEADVLPEMYVPLGQWKEAPFGGSSRGSLVIRSSSGIRAVARAVRAAIRPVTGEPSQPRFMEDDFRGITVGRRFNAQLMSVFGLLAFAIGGIGVFGTTAFVVAQQVPAIGVRIALGATPGHILGSVLVTALNRVGVGVLLGFCVAWKGASVMAAFVFNIRPTEPFVLVGVAGFLALLGLTAAMVPAIRASRINPLDTIRQE